MNHREEELFTALARAAEQRVMELNQQDVAKRAWVFATVNHRDEMLFTALARAAQRRVGESNE